jgi:catechol 2,3-dioxygenase-like lactoylglutathione lyase family enzyme
MAIAPAGPRAGPIAAGVALSHATLEVAELARSIDFYAEVLGFEIFHDGRCDPRRPSVKGMIGDVCLELEQGAAAPHPSVRRPFGVPPGAPSLSFAVSNLDAAFARLTALGLVGVERPSARRGIRLFYVFDPGGQTVELIQFPAPWRVLADLRGHLA